MFRSYDHLQTEIYTSEIDITSNLLKMVYNLRGVK
jgi:hypothetical protein